MPGFHTPETSYLYVSAYHAWLKGATHDFAFISTFRLLDFFYSSTAGMLIESRSKISCKTSNIEKKYKEREMKGTHKTLGFFSLSCV